MTPKQRLMIVVLLTAAACLGIALAVSQTLYQQAAEPAINASLTDCSGKNRQACFDKQFELDKVGNNPSAELQESLQNTE